MATEQLLAPDLQPPDKPPTVATDTPGEGEEEERVRVIGEIVGMPQWAAAALAEILSPPLL